jgi:hypothetical protein
VSLSYLRVSTRKGGTRFYFACFPCFLLVKWIIQGAVISRDHQWII